MSAAPRPGGPRQTLHIPASPVCNNNCAFCNEDDASRQRINTRYSDARVQAMLEQHRGRVSKVIFTSGEPLLNPRIVDLVQMAHDLGYRDISITTNGRMLAYLKLALRLVAAGATEFIVSIHGHHARSHERLTRTRGSFEQTVRGMQHVAMIARSRPVRLVAAVTLTRINLPHFGQLVEFTQRVGADETVFNVVQPIRAKMDTAFERLMPSYAEVAAELRACYGAHPDRFETQEIGNVRRAVSVIDLPPCQAPELAELLGYGETRIVRDVCTDSADDAIVDVERVFVDNAGVKVKAESCAACVFVSRCSGVYVRYVDRRGWAEFVPIRERPASHR